MGTVGQRKGTLTWSGIVRVIGRLVNNPLFSSHFSYLSFINHSEVAAHTFHRFDGTLNIYPIWATILAAYLKIQNFKK